MTDGDDRQEIYTAIYHGDVDRLDELQRNGMELDYISIGDNWNYLTGMLSANADRLTVEMIQYLIDVGNDVNLVDRYNNTSVMYAVRAKRADILEVLLKAGGKVEYFNIDEQSPLVMAVEFNDTEYACARMLMDHGADPDLESSSGISARKVVESFLGHPEENPALRKFHDQYLK